jgi:hypothetical protein
MHDLGVGALAIRTVSYEYGSQRDVIAREAAARTWFDLVTPEKVSEILLERYQLDYLLKGEIFQTRGNWFRAGFQPTPSHTPLRGNT